MTTNPAPRQALRKAADAQIHPAAGKPGPTLAPVDPAPTRRPEPTEKPSKSKRAAKPGKKFRGATSDVLRPAPDPARDLLLGKQVTLEVQVPKRLRKAARAQAERHDTTVDAVVTGLLAGWVDGS